MEVLALDTETFPIRKGLAAPPYVCVGWARIVDGVTLERGLITSRGEAAGDVFAGIVGELSLGNLIRAFADYARVLGPTECRIVNQNIPFDFAVAAADDEELIDLIFDLYDEGFIEGIDVREQLLDIARGSLGWSQTRRTAKGTTAKKKYNLAEMAFDYLGWELDKTSWRTGYARLANVPLARWPQGAIDYGIVDAEAAGLIWFSQRDAALDEGVPEPGEIPDSVPQSRYHWGLHLTSVWGIRTDPAAVFAFKTSLVRAKAVLTQVMSQVFVCTDELEKQDRTCPHDLRAPLKGGCSMCVSCGATLEPFLRQPKKNGKVGKNKKAIASAIIELCDEREVAPKLTDTGADLVKKDAFPAEKLHKYVSQKSEHIDDLLMLYPEVPMPNDLDEALALAREILEDGKVPSTLEGLTLLSWHNSVEKLLGTYIPPLETGTRVPICATYRPLVETGRASCSGPNMMNLPKAPGVRECYVPRPGFTFCSVDYEALELHTLAQACLELVGQSKLAEALNEGLDPHLLLAVEWLTEGLTYDEAKAIRKDETHPRHAEVVKARNMAKCFHPDTEFLTRSGWKKFDDLRPGEEIAQAQPHDDGRAPTLTWTVPYNLFKKRASKLVHLRSEGVDLRVTDDHRMLTFNAKHQPVVCTPTEFSKKRGFWNAGHLGPDAADVHVPEHMLRLAVATQADGSFAGAPSCVRFGFSKNRKKKRLEELLQACRDSGAFVDVHTTGSDVEGEVKSYTIKGPTNYELRRLLPGKHFPSQWRALDAASREVFLDEARYWDSHTPPRGVAYSFCSTSKEDCEVLQHVATLQGRKTRLVQEAQEEGNHRAAWKLTVRTKADSRGGNVETTVEAYDGDVVCLSVDASFVVVRSGGVPIICGQCANFGLPGGLGAQRFVDFCKTSGIALTLGEAQALKDAWFKQWPEMRLYFRHIKELLYVPDDAVEDEDGKLPTFATIEQIGSGRVRGRTRYTASCNSFFQGLGADAAKLAVYELSKACYRSDGELRGSRLVVFVHDETIMEHPKHDRVDTHRRAFVQTRIMLECLNHFCSDVHGKAEPALMPRWYKEAKAKYDDDGILMEWTPQPSA